MTMTNHVDNDDDDVLLQACDNWESNTGPNNPHIMDAISAALLKPFALTIT